MCGSHVWKRATRPLAFDLDFDFARVERTLLSVAFDFGRFVSGYAFRHTASPALPWKSGASAPRKVHKSMRASAPEGTPPRFMVEACRPTHHTPAPEGRHTLAPDVSPG